MSLYATINNFISENAIIFSVLIPIISGGSGIYFTYKMTIKSDKRKEFNDVAEPIIDLMISSLKSVEKLYWKPCYLNDVDLRMVERRLSNKKQKTFKKLFDYHHNLTKIINDKINEQESLAKEPIFGGSYDLNKIYELKEYIDNLKNLIKILKLK